MLLSALPPAISAIAARKAFGQPFLGADKRFQLVWPLLEHLEHAKLEHLLSRPSKGAAASGGSLEVDYSGELHAQGARRKGSDDAGFEKSASHCAIRRACISCPLIRSAWNTMTRREACWAAGKQQ